MMCLNEMKTERDIWMYVHINRRNFCSSIHVSITITEHIYINVNT